MANSAQSRGTSLTSRMSLLVAILIGFPFMVSADSLPAAFDVRVEHQVNPIGITNPQPRFTWRLAVAGRGKKEILNACRVHGVYISNSV